MHIGLRSRQIGLQPTQLPPQAERKNAALSERMDSPARLPRAQPLKGKSQIDFATWLLFMPATPYSPNTFACSTIGPAGLYLRRLEAVSVAPFATREPSAEILSALCDGSRAASRRRFMNTMRGLIRRSIAMGCASSGSQRYLL